MDMKMGAHALNIVRKKDERFKIKEVWHANGYVQKDPAKGRNGHESF
jgi:hypothetical protein